MRSNNDQPIWSMIQLLFILVIWHHCIFFSRFIFFVELTTFKIFSYASACRWNCSENIHKKLQKRNANVSKYCYYQLWSFKSILLIRLSLAFILINRYILIFRITWILRWSLYYSIFVILIGIGEEGFRSSLLIIFIIYSMRIAYPNTMNYFFC